MPSALTPQFGLGAEPTMSSREIAELLGSRHDDVKRSIERLAERGVITLPPLAEVSNPGLGPRTIKEYRVGKRDSYVIVAQLSPEFTARLVDRWQELEQTVAFAKLPDFTSPAIAARAWADQVELRQAAERQITVLGPKADAYDAFINADGLFGYQNAGRALGCRPRLFTEWLQKKYCFHQGGVLIPRAQYVDAGLFVVKGELGTDEVTRPRGWVTPKGLDYLASRIPPEIMVSPPQHNGDQSAHVAVLERFVNRGPAQ
jgi:phage regulator Rha-like protein